MLRWGRVEVTGGFLLLAAALYYLDEQGVLLWGALACAFHELGHYVMIDLCGGKISRLRLSVTGAEMALSPARPMGPLSQVLTALAGPAVNLGLALFSARLAVRFGEEWYLFAGLNLTLALFNLLPASQLDGGRALRGILSLLCPGAAERAAAVVSWLAAVGAAAAGVMLFWQTGANLTLLITSLWLAAAQLRQRSQGRGAALRF